jgi:hypothetical protein
MSVTRQPLAWRERVWLSPRPPPRCALSAVADQSVISFFKNGIEKRILESHPTYRSFVHTEALLTNNKAKL